jgi:glutathionylspermidine synthase
MTQAVHAEVAEATSELHRCFVAATRAVFERPELWPAFGFPQPFWEKARRSLERGDKVISGRVDWTFTLNETSARFEPESFEYNADSASCLLECGLAQGGWARAMHLGELGVDGGRTTEAQLTEAWRALGLPKGTVVHFFYDAGP